MNTRWLHLHLAAPLMAFGGVAIDHVGPTRTYPSASALVGLFANALGWRREERDAHQALQDRLVFGALSVLPGGRHVPSVVTDNQNARLFEQEPAWTTSGAPETRNKGKSYSNPAAKTQDGNQAGRKWMTHRRRRDYLAGHESRVVLRLTGEDAPTLDDLATALDRPARPLFIGRKPCLPTTRLFAGWVEAETARAALVALGLTGRGLWPEEGDTPPGAERHDLADLRNWRSGLHAGSRLVAEGVIG